VVRVHVQCKKECDCKFRSGAMQNVLLGSRIDFGNPSRRQGTLRAAGVFSVPPCFSIVAGGSTPTLRAKRCVVFSDIGWLSF
jgi:hypothetical protein